MPVGRRIFDMAPHVARERAMKVPQKKFVAAAADDPLWYKDAIIYQCHVKSFFDSNNDGVGDFPGLIAKLDYIAESGCCHSILRPGSMTDTTSATIARYIRNTARLPISSASSRPRMRAASASSPSW